MKSITLLSILSFIISIAIIISGGVVILSCTPSSAIQSNAQIKNTDINYLSDSFKSIPHVQAWTIDWYVWEPDIINLRISLDDTVGDQSFRFNKIKISDIPLKIEQIKRVIHCYQGD